MVLHKDSHTIVVGLPNLFQNTGNPAIVLVVQINNMIALLHYFVLFYCFRKIHETHPMYFWKFHAIRRCQSKDTSIMK